MLVLVLVLMLVLMLASLQHSTHSTHHLRQGMCQRDLPTVTAGAYLDTTETRRSPTDTALISGVCIIYMCINRTVSSYGCRQC
jgi:hypothetical protein